MKRLIFIAFLFLAIFSSCQVPSVGGFQVPGVTEEEGSYNPSGWVYSGDKFGISDYVTSYGAAFFFNNNGTKVFILDGGNDRVVEWSMSTAYDITTMAYESTESVSESAYPGDIEPSDSGDKLYVLDFFQNGSRRIYEYSMSTNWDLSTLSYTTSFYYGDNTSNVYSINIYNGGSDYVLWGSLHDNLVEYSITDWNISTSSYIQEGGYSDKSVIGTEISGDGSYLYLVTYGGVLYFNSISPSYDFTSYSFPTETSFIFDRDPTISRDIIMHPDGDVLFVIDNTHIYKWIAQ